MLLLNEYTQHEWPFFSDADLYIPSPNPQGTNLLP